MNTLIDAPPADRDNPEQFPVAKLLPVHDLKRYRAAYTARWLADEPLSIAERAHWQEIEAAHAEYLDAVRFTYRHTPAGDGARAGAGA